VTFANAKDLADARRDPDRAVIRPMPTRLIKPLKSALDAPDEAVKRVWGLEAVRATTSPQTGKGVRVAVLDTGIDASHPAFDGVELVQRNFTAKATRTWTDTGRTAPERSSGATSTARGSASPHTSPPP